ncbi:hypothetical protein F4820DRAFT_444308 [Hypoxylon rubiginosum]|uniref:Uncharacterized protein n=1 Tax=Hypoxylon rubiginosum TaxID=110542 RepID=A0ACB9ZBJ9_9PEZI|nr:hypothetical protein F4820DRAFT_444308 [Hypoxylon rubiginosum]
MSFVPVYSNTPISQDQQYSEECQFEAIRNWIWYLQSKIMELGQHLDYSITTLIPYTPEWFAANEYVAAQFETLSYGVAFHRSWLQHLQQTQQAEQQSQLQAEQEAQLQAQQEAQQQIRQQFQQQVQQKIQQQAELEAQQQAQQQGSEPEPIVNHAKLRYRAQLNELNQKLETVHEEATGEKQEEVNSQGEI